MVKRRRKVVCSVQISWRACGAVRCVERRFGGFGVGGGSVVRRGEAKRVEGWKMGWFYVVV